VLIQQVLGTPIVCNDGFTIAKEFEPLLRPFRDLNVSPSPYLCCSDGGERRDTFVNSSLRA
jgi:hypothetical protein